MRNDHILLRRSLLTSPAWKHADFWRLWCWCLLNAAHKARTTVLGGVPTPVAAGQLAATMEEIRTGTGLEPEAILKSLAIGKNIGLLELRRSPWGLRIAIVSWQEHLEQHRSGSAF